MSIGRAILITVEVICLYCGYYVADQNSEYIVVSIVWGFGAFIVANLMFFALGLLLGVFCDAWGKLK
jgi:MFS-type transporter involved in bile tolerance (Atg22 family)